MILPHARALGQIELILALAASHLFFRERCKIAELLGVALITVGILTLVLLR